MCHRDLKPENVLLSSADDENPQVKICDFGLSVALSPDGKLGEKQGTWAYWAPEMFGECRYSGREVRAQHTPRHLGFTRRVHLEPHPAAATSPSYHP